LIGRASWVNMSLELWSVGDLMDKGNPRVDVALEGVDESKRSTLRRLIGTGVFVAPIVASFAMAGLGLDAFLHSAAASG
jgi:hypothetical protein